MLRAACASLRRVVVVIDIVDPYRLRRSRTSVPRGISSALRPSFRPSGARHVAAASDASPIASSSSTDMRTMKTPRDVLSFWFSEAAYFGAEPELMSSVAFMSAKAKTQWYAGTSADASCMPFVPTIEAAAAGHLDHLPEWSAHVDGKVAKLILFDQLTRNCFRGTPRAFACDDKALALAREMASEPSVVDVHAPAVVHFLTSPLIHSEDLADQDLALAVNDKLMRVAPDIARFARGAIESHRDVVVRFGRFPHRNKSMGRESTPEETAWLASDEVPGWAKTQ